MNGRPVYIKGQRIIGNDTIGSHTWVVDGCYVKSFPLYPPHPYFFSNSIKHLHCNWGNNGDYDGFYQMDVLLPSNTSIPYTNVGIIHHIYPNNLK